MYIYFIFLLVLFLWRTLIKCHSLGSFRYRGKSHLAKGPLHEKHDAATSLNWKMRTRLDQVLMKLCVHLLSSTLGAQHSSG